MSDEQNQIHFDEVKPEVKLSASERMRKVWEMRKAAAASQQGSKPSKSSKKKHPANNPAGSTASQRMKKAWATRRKNLQAQAGAAPSRAASPAVAVQLTINGDKALFQRYVGYIDAARNLGDFSILNSENFSRVEQALKSKIR